MGNSKKDYQFISLAVLMSGFCSSCAVGDHFQQENQPAAIGEAQAVTSGQAKSKEELNLDAEALQQAEAKLAQILAGRELQFKSVIAKIYASNDFTPLWTDKNAEKQFLREYALMVASGVSLHSAQSLALIDSATSEEIVRDILISDAFLDYMYYSQNVADVAQKWLYGKYRYKAEKPQDEQIYQWLSAVKNQQVLDFVNQITKGNVLYRQTTDYIVANINNPDKKILGTLPKLALNAQRLRVIPDFHTGIFVNIPSYELNYYRDGVLVLNSRVIVGKTERKTPVMHSRLSNVVVNPPWNAPTRLVNEDIIPQVKNDPSYLARNGYNIIDSKGQIVDPESIDWSLIGNRFPYGLRQSAGLNSALGRYKFNMPSSEAIYLHDTPKHSLFKKKVRALSSGCVRVDKSDELATILLSEAGWTKERKQKTLDSQKTVSAPIQSDNPVYLYYVTTWVENGQVKKLADIYSYDVATSPSFVDWTIIQRYL